MDFFRSLFTKDYDPFQIYDLSENESHTLKITVKHGSKISKGSFNDFVDTPDPYVDVLVMNNPCGLKRTQTHWNEVNPVWNEEFKFIVNPSLENILRIRLQDADVISGDDTIYEKTYDIKSFPLEKTKNIILKFGKSSEVHIEVIRMKNNLADVRHGLELCEDEAKFVEERRKLVMQYLSELLEGDDAPQEENEVPVIALMGSGGGFRAMASFSGVTKALHQTGLINAATYTSALSGSAWYQAKLYTQPECPNPDLKETETEMRKSFMKDNFLLKMLAPLTALKYSGRAKEEQGFRKLPRTLTDIMAYNLENFFLSERAKCTLSDQRKCISDAKMPLPLYSSVSVKSETSELIFHDFVEYSPYEIGIPKYGTFIRPEVYGSRFFMGHVIERFEEVPLSFLMGAWGSAYTVSLSRLTSDMDDPDKVAKRVAEHKDEAEYAFEGLNEDEEKEIKSQWENKMNEDAKDGKTGEEGDNKGTNMNGKTSDKPEVKKSGGLGASIKNAILDMKLLNTQAYKASIIYNISHGLEPKSTNVQKTINLEEDEMFGEVFDNYPSSAGYQYIIDAGLVFNSPYPAVLRTQRKVDIILSFDFSFRQKDNEKLFKNLKLASVWAKLHNIPFPEIDEEEALKDGLKECFVFEDPLKPNCPIILHFPLINISFKQYKAPGVERETEEEKKFADYSLFEDGKGTNSTFNFHFDQIKFDRLTRLMEYNTLNTTEQIKDAIKRVIQMKRKIAMEEKESFKGKFNQFLSKK